MDIDEKLKKKKKELIYIFILFKVAYPLGVAQARGKKP